MPNGQVVSASTEIYNVVGIVPYRPCHTLQYNWSFSCDFELIDASQTIGDHCMYFL